MAAMHHGLPVVSTTGRLTDRQLFDHSPLLLSEVNDAAGFVSLAVRLSSDASERAAASEPTAAFYNRHFSWPVIADRFSALCLDAA